MRYFSLFSGIGGFEVGIEKAWESLVHTRGDIKGEETTLHGNITKTKRRNDTSIKWNSKVLCVGCSEIDKYATAIYRYHFSDHRNYGDATRIDTRQLPDFDLLVAGFPCQSFSIAGKRKGMPGEDTRGTLFFEIWRVARDKRPRTLLLENVPGLLSSRNGKDFLAILTSLDEIGYDVEWDCLNAKNFRVPQNRERVFIVGHLGGQRARKVFPIRETNTIYTETATCLDANYHKGWLDHGQRTMIKVINEPRYENFVLSDIVQNMTATGKANQTRIINQQSIRRLTPTECERLMAFPDGWTEHGIIDGRKVKISDTQRYKCLGNAVVSNVVAEVIKAIFKGVD